MIVFKNYRDVSTNMRANICDYFVKVTTVGDTSEKLEYLSAILFRGT